MIPVWEILTTYILHVIFAPLAYPVGVTVLCICNDRVCVQYVGTECTGEDDVQYCLFPDMVMH